MTQEARRWHPQETGGVLLGYWTWLGEEAVITDVIGPGPEAVHERYRFVPDVDHQESEIARLYAASGRRIAYLGDWHTHPDTEAGHLSWKDRRTLRRIATEKSARAPVPLMCILTGGPEEWRPHVWRGQITRVFGLPLGLTVCAAALHLY